MTIDEKIDARLIEQEVTDSKILPEARNYRVSWGAILAGVVVALLAQFAMEMLGVAIGVGAFEPGEDVLGPAFSTGIVVWLAVTALLSLFAGGLVTGKLSGTADPSSGILQALVMMGIVTFISVFFLTSTLSATFRGVSNAIGEGLSFVGAALEDVSPAVANAVELEDSTLESIRAEADDLLAEDASLNSLIIAIDDYILADQPGDDTRQAAITALATQTELTEAEAAAQLDEWESEFRLTVNRLENTAEQVASDIADVIAATAGIIFMIIIAGAFAAAAGGYVAVSGEDPEYYRERTITKRRQAAEATT